MTEKVPKWTFELAKVPASTDIRWYIKDSNGTVMAQSVDFVNLAGAHDTINIIKEHASTFEVHTLPG